MKRSLRRTALLWISSFSVRTIWKTYKLSLKWTNISWILIGKKIKSWLQLAAFEPGLFESIVWSFSTQAPRRQRCQVYFCKRSEWIILFVEKKSSRRYFLSCGGSRKTATPKKWLFYSFSTAHSGIGFFRQCPSSPVWDKPSCGARNVWANDIHTKWHWKTIKNGALLALMLLKFMFFCRRAALKHAINANTAN